MPPLRLHGRMDVPRDDVRGWGRASPGAHSPEVHTGLAPLQVCPPERAVRAVSHQDIVRLSLWAPTARLKRFEVVCGAEHPSSSGALLTPGTGN